jgi:NADH-quinone oxidoreductase subunit C
VTADELAALISARLGPGAVSEISGAGPTVTADVPPSGWLGALTFARDELGCDAFGWLSAVDELPDGFAILAHVFARAAGHHLLLRTRVGPGAPHLPTAAQLYREAAAHERETMQRFGVTFDGHPDRATLPLPDGFGDHRA